jgi:hypothetical protein
MKMFMHLWFVAEFSFEWEIFQAKSQRKSNISLSTNVFENRAVREITLKNTAETQRA